MTIRFAARIAPALVFLCVLVRAALAADALLSLRDLLERLRSTGANIIYSSQLVQPEMTVPAGLSGLDLWTQVRRALAAHGLELRDLGGGTYSVTLAPERTPALPPQVRDPAPALSEVSVYASRYELGRDALAEPRLVNSTDIEGTPGGQDDAMRAVRTVPGLATNVSARPYIRGSYVDDVLVQFDGVPLADPFHLKNFQSLISAFDPEAVESIEVFSGGFPVRYGTRSGGVIDLHPRSVDSGYEHSFGASLLAYDVSSVGRAEHWPVDWLVTLRHSMPDVVLKPVNGDEGEPGFSDTLGRVRWHVNARSTITLGWLLLDDQIELRTDAADEAARARYRDEYAWVAYEAGAGERWHGRTVLSGAWGERRRSGTLDAPAIAMENLREEREFSTGEIRSHWTFEQSDRQWWELSLEWAKSKADLSYTRAGTLAPAVAASFGRDINVAQDADISPTASTYAFSLATRHRWTQVEGELGVRLDAQDYAGTRRHQQWSPRINLRYDIAPAWRAYASWGEFTQAQRVDEWRTEEGQLEPDPAALAVHAVVGLSYASPPTWRMSVEAYRKRWSRVTPYHDNLFTTLSLLPDLQPDRVLVRPSSSEAAGIEVLLRKKVTPTVEVSAAYAYSRVMDTVAGRDDVPRSWDQPHALNLGLTWSEGRWRSSLLLGWHRGWPRTQLSPTSDSGVALGVGARNAERWSNYLTADMSASWTYGLAHSDLALWVDLTNGTDRSNLCCVHLGSPVAPAVTPSIAMNEWMRRTANLGFTWRVRP